MTRQGPRQDVGFVTVGALPSVSLGAVVVVIVVISPPPPQLRKSDDLFSLDLSRLGRRSGSGIGSTAERYLSATFLDGIP